MDLEISAASLEDGSSGEDHPALTFNDQDSYMSNIHHGADSYMRAENWLPDVADFTFASRIISLSRDEAKAITQYRDEVKLRAAARNQDAAEQCEDASVLSSVLFSPDYLNEMYDFIMDDWPQDSQTAAAHRHLMCVQHALDQAIREFAPKGAFVKLSIRSPKDSALNMTSTRQLIRSLLAGSTQELGSAAATNEDICAMCNACAQVLRCHDGSHALRLLLESDRVYKDLVAHELLLPEGEDFNLKLIVREWDDAINGDWEFRAFVVDGKLTCVTQYNDFVFDARISANKEVIRAMIYECWQAVRPNIKSKNYCIDFAVLPDLSSTLIVEVNAVLPPIAGSGLFDWQDPVDMKIIRSGGADDAAFEFRVREIEVLPESTRQIHPPLVKFIQSLRDEATQQPSRRCVVC